MRVAIWHGSHLCVGFFLYIIAPWSESVPHKTPNFPPKSGVFYCPSTMPGQRSYMQASGPLTVRQQSRIEKDQWYRTSHSRPNTSFIECSSDIAPQIKIMAKTKQKHYALDMVNELPSHHGRNASELARKLGKIPLCEHVDNLKFFRAAGTAKHVNAIRKNKTAAWADINDDESGDDKLPPPPVSGRYEASTNDSILATTQSVKLLPPPASGKQQQSATHVAPARERQQTCSHSGATVQGALCAGTTRCPQVEQLVLGALCAGTTRCPSGGAAPLVPHHLEL